MYIGKKLIDTHTGGGYMYGSLNNSTTKEIIDKIGKYPELYDAESINGTYPSHIGNPNPSSIEGRQLYIPPDF